VTPEEAADLLDRHHAMLNGHFELTSGRHSDRYVQKARLLEHPEATLEVAREMNSWYGRIDVVIAPAVGALTLGFAVALVAGARAIYAEREKGRMALRRGFRIEPGERVLVVEDVVTTGGSARDVYELIGESGAERLGVAAIVDRSTVRLDFPLRALLRVDATTWLAEECPLCRGGAAIDMPGSRRLQGEPA
jgi:orotate phosphoribosyltransferase